MRINFSRVEWLITALIVFSVVFVIRGLIQENAQHERMVQQCMDDGKREYECRAMLKREQPTTVILR